jgi:hypothetical protein
MNKKDIKAKAITEQPAPPPKSFKPENNDSVGWIVFIAVCIVGIGLVVYKKYMKEK